MIKILGHHIQIGWVLFKLIGLIIGLTASLAILAFVAGEYSSERWIAGQENIVLVGVNMPGNVDATGTPDPKLIGKLPFRMGAAFTSRFDAVQAHTRLFTSRFPIAKDDRAESKEIAFIERNFFRFFPFKTITGEYYTGPNGPEKIVVSTKFADDWFGSTDIIGQTIRLNHQVGLKTYTIDAVLAPLAGKTHLEHYDVFILGQKKDFTSSYYLYVNYMNPDFKTYLKLKPNTDRTALANDMAEIGFVFNKRSGYGEGHIFSSPNDKFALIALRDLFKTHLKHGIYGVEYSNGRLISSFSFMGVIVLLLAVFNYIMMAIVTIEKQIRPLSIQKILGQSKASIIKPIYGAALLYTMVAAIFALLLMNPLAIILFDFELARQKLWANPLTLPLSMGLLFCTVLAAGSIPSLIALRINPVHILSGTLRRSLPLQILKKALVFLQIGVAAGLLLISSLFVHQTNFLQTRTLGFEKENLIAIDDIQSDNQWIDGLVLRLKQKLPDIQTSRGMVRAGTGMQGFPAKYAKKHADGFVNISQQGVEANYFDVLGADFIAGRPFGDKENSTEPVPIIINQTLLHQIGYENAQNAIGQVIRKLPQKESHAPRFPARDELIIGVIKDIQLQGRNKIVRPLSYHKDGYPASIFIRVQNTLDIEIVRDVIRNYSDEPLIVKFISELYHDLYAQEEKSANRMRICTVLALILAALGIFGLASQTALSQEKTLAVHRVMGAGFGALLILMMRSILIYSLLAGILGCLGVIPYHQNWLEQFVDHAPQSFWPYVKTICLILMLVIICNLWPVLRAIFTDPAHKLRDD